MPALSTSMGTSEGDAAAAQESKDGHPWGGAGTSPGAQGVSFARMTRLGLAAGGEGGPSLQDVYRGGEGGQSGVWQAPGAAGAWGRRPTVVQEVAGEAQSPGDDGDGAGMVSLGSLMVGRGEGGRKGKGKGKGGGKKTTLFTIG